MAHEIDTTTGKAAVFVTGEPAWHKLGTVVSEAQTSVEAITLAGLDWTVEKKNIAAAIADGQWAPIPNQVANVRSDTNAVLGVVGTTYRAFQNHEAFDFMDTLVDDKLAMYETAGSLKGGRRVWMMARIPKTYRVGEDVVDPYVLLTNAHDGTQSLRMFPTTVRVVCQNTLTYAENLAGSTGIRISHWSRLETRVKEARQKLGLIGSHLDQFGKEMVAMAARKLTGSEARDYFRGMFPTQTKTQAAAARGINTDNLLDSILDNHDQQDEVMNDLLAGHYAETEARGKRNAVILDTVLGNFENERNSLPGIERSAWAAYNAISEWADHGRKSRGRTDEERADNQLNSIWFGSSNEIKQNAYQSALSLVS